MTYLELIRDADKQLDDGRITIGEYENMIKPLERQIQPEIIHCGECRFREIRGVDGFCDHITGEPIMVKKTDHCSWGEKKHVENS